MSEISTKPYLIRAIYEWCSDSSLTPYLIVLVDEQTRVPMEYVQHGEIVLNIGYSATRNITINNDLIQFSARFGGVSREISVPISAVKGIFAHENGQGLFFNPEDNKLPQTQNPNNNSPDDSGPQSPKPGKPKLQVVK